MTRSTQWREDEREAAFVYLSGHTREGELPVSRRVFQSFDSNILGIRPHLVLEVREDILDEVDGPMLRHGLQEMHGSSILVPTRQQLRPSSVALEQRYAQFQDA